MTPRLAIALCFLTLPAHTACGATPVDGPAGSIRITIEFKDAVLGYPLGGLEVCVPGRDDYPCAKTGSDGRISAPVPPDSDVMLQCAAPMHVTTYMTLRTPGADFDVGVFRLLEKATADLFAQTAGVAPDPTRGILLVNVYDDLVKRTVRVPDATTTLVSGGTATPVYGGGFALPDSTLTATSPGGPAGFYDLAPGDYTVSLAHPARACSRGFAWPDADENTVRTRVFAGGMSTVTWFCPP